MVNCDNKPVILLCISNIFEYYYLHSTNPWSPSLVPIFTIFFFSCVAVNWSSLNLPQPSFSAPLLLCCSCSHVATFIANARGWQWRDVTRMDILWRHNVWWRHFLRRSVSCILSWPPQQLAQQYIYLLYILVCWILSSSVSCWSDEMFTVEPQRQVRWSHSLRWQHSNYLNARGKERQRKTAPTPDEREKNVWKTVWTRIRSDA